jgi:quercetin dioxygenase-like cupin family protein
MELPGAPLLDVGMIEPDTRATDRLIVDLAALATSGPDAGPVWTHQTNDLNVNLVVFTAGNGVAEHVNAEVDVLVVGIAGQGRVDMDGRAHSLGAGQALVIPNGARRAIRAESARFAYLTCHRRRAALWPTVRPPSET